MSDAYTDNRETLRVFYAPKEPTKTPAQIHEEKLLARIAELETRCDLLHEEVGTLTLRLAERTQELLEALETLEEGGLI